MYWCRMATADDVDEIAKLNYEAFVEEIPQHAPNEQQRLVDRFHKENTYVLVLKEHVIIGMVAFREQRPFSIDGKIGAVEQYLPADVCEKICELRLLTIRKNYRNGRALLRLFKALYAYFYEQSYTGVVISGTVREEKLYKDIGFTQFAEAVGTEDARYLPMVITKEAIDTFRSRILKDRKVFYPGPVEQTGAVATTAISHRGIDGMQMFGQCQQQLKRLAHSEYVAIINGSGTAANDMMFATIQAQFKGKRGLIVSNGEFGERLAKQAEAWQLPFIHIKLAWGQSFDVVKIEQILQQEIAWVAFVHGETSMGTLNPLEELTQIANKYKVKVCVDCISSFGALPFSLRAVYLATATSGKAVGALAGLAFVFYNERIQVSHVPHYVNISTYHEQMPFTIPVYLLRNVLDKLAQYPTRYTLLQSRLQRVLASVLMQDLGRQTAHYPMIVSLQATDFVLCARLNDLDLHADSRYLQQADIAQISIIQPSFEQDFSQLQTLYDYFKRG